MDGRLARVLVAVLAVAVAVVGGRVAYDRWREWRAERYVVTREDDGRAITRVVAAAFDKTSALQVGELTGIVQGTATDSRLLGLLNADRVVKAPFSVDYMIDLSRLDAGDMAWDARTRTLRVDAPDVTVARPNIDEGAATLVSTRGLFVTRAASDLLARRVSIGAARSAAAAARTPARIAQARANARAAIARLLAAPLAATGHGDIRVRVRFPFDPRSSPERWDESRALDQVLANAR